jgi:hypothetical protein
VNDILVRAGAAAALVASLLLGSAAPAVASCIMPPPIEDAIRDADVAFVGTVTNVANDGRWATVAVAEVWAGPDLPSIVQVRGGPDPGTFSSVDRAFTARTTYLFLPGISEGAIHDSACSSTMEWTDDLARLRPATARLPVGAEPESGAGSSFDPGALLLPAALILGAGIVVFGAAHMIRRAS